MLADPLAPVDGGCERDGAVGGGAEHRPRELGHGGQEGRDPRRGQDGRNLQGKIWQLLQVSSRCW